MSTTREAMVRSAAILLAQRGYQGTSFAAVLEHSGAPRGSIYHHFPDGKDQLVAAAMVAAGDQAFALLESLRGRSPAEIAEGFGAMWRAVLTVSDYTAGCSVLAVTVAADSSELTTLAQSIFASWRERLSELLVDSGAEVADGSAYAALLIAGCEGGVVMARADRSLEPFEAVLRQLVSAAPTV
jgi:AcrR family transcriptional regulator